MAAGAVAGAGVVRAEGSDLMIVELHLRPPSVASRPYQAGSEKSA